MNCTHEKKRKSSHGSQVPSLLRSTCAILAMESMGIGTQNFTWGPKSQVWRGCLHGNTPRRWGLGLHLGVQSSKKLDLSPKYDMELSRTQLPRQVPNLTSHKCCHVGIHAKPKTWNPIRSCESQFPWSQLLRLHKSTSSDLGFRTSEPVWTDPVTTMSWTRLPIFFYWIFNIRTYFLPFTICL